MNRNAPPQMFLSGNPFCRSEAPGSPSFAQFSDAVESSLSVAKRPSAPASCIVRMAFLPLPYTFSSGVSRFPINNRLTTNRARNQFSTAGARFPLPHDFGFMLPFKLGEFRSSKTPSILRRRKTTLPWALNPPSPQRLSPQRRSPSLHDRIPNSMIYVGA